MREHSSVVVIGGGIYWIPDASESLPRDTQYATRGIECSGYDFDRTSTHFADLDSCLNLK